MLSGDCEIGYH